MLKRTLSLVLAVFLVFSLSACTGKTSGYKAGTYTGVAKGYIGDITVDVTLSTDKIEDVKVVSHTETEDIGGIAVNKLPSQIVETQSIQVDTVTGATFSSNAIIEAVTLALKSAGVDAAKLVPVTGNNDGKEEKVIDVDVVVIGAGGAGMSAAIEAATAGKKVAIIEKAPMAGGNTTRSTGGMNAAKTTEQDTNTFEENAGVEKTIATAKEKYPELKDLVATVEKQYADYQAKPEGYFDSPELFILDTLVGGKNINNPELVQTLVEQSGPTIEWLKTIGADLTSVGSFGGASVKRIHKPVNAEGKTVAVGSYLVPIFTENLTDLGVEAIYDTAATEILMKDGAVAGVKADGYTINAKAVVIATGGFGANLDMVTELNPNLEGFVTTNAPTITGDGITMAEAVGAATVDMDQIQIHPTVEQTTSALITEGLRGDGAILVNAEGKRFIDEVGTRDVVSAAEVAQTGGYAYLIVDQKMVDDSAVIQGYIKQGLTVTGASVEELAKAMNVDAAALTETMKNWNAAVSAKEDKEFGRTSFTNPLETAPYFAVKVAPGVHHTMGGISINSNTEVLDAEGNAIAGLYAAGEVAGGVHGANRLGGNAVADVIVFGRIAGQQAASYVK